MPKFSSSAFGNDLLSLSFKDMVLLFFGKTLQEGSLKISRKSIPKMIAIEEKNRVKNG